MYQTECKRRASIDPNAAPTEEWNELPRKKDGRPLLLPNELDNQVKEYIKALRQHGLPINTHVVVAAAEGIVMNEYGISSCDGEPMVKFNLTTDWAKSVLERMYW